MPLNPPPWPRWVRVLVALAMAPLVGLLVGTLTGRPLFGIIFLTAMIGSSLMATEWQRRRAARRTAR